jgi:predicted Zn-dependent protease
MPGATLFVADPAFVRRIMEAAPHLTARAWRWRAARPWIAAGLALGAIAGVAWLAGFSPASAIARRLPDGLRERMGAQVVASMAGQRRLCEAPAGRAALDKLTTRLAAASGEKARFQVVVVDWSLLNAFAAPGEQIVLTRELVEKAAGPDELAGVLAHEMGHGLERHPETGIIRGIGLAAGLELLTGGGSGSLANIGLLLTQLSYTRAAEREADAHALRMLERAGISPKGITDFFKRVEQLESRSAAGRAIGQIDILRTHPQSAERAKEAAAQPSYPTTPALEPSDWAALKAICRP